jgi:hypothetical protein
MDILEEHVIYLCCHLLAHEAVADREHDEAGDQRDEPLDSEIKTKTRHQPVITNDGLMVSLMKYFRRFSPNKKKIRFSSCR